MRQASRAFKRQEILDMNLPTQIKPSMQAIMEVEDMIGETSLDQKNRTHYYSATAEEGKEPLDEPRLMPVFSQAENSKESLKNSPPSNDSPNYLEKAAGNSSKDNHRFSNAMDTNNMHKSYAIRKESGVTTQDGGKPNSSNQGQLDNIIEENLESPEKKDEVIEEDKQSSTDENNPYDQTE